MKHVALMTCSRKGGHRFPTLTLAAFLSRARPPAISVTVVNLLDHIPLADRLDCIGRWGDLHLPFLWQSGYARLYNAEPSFSGLNRFFLAAVLANNDSRRRWRRAIGPADLIVSFQPDVNCITRWLKREFSVPVYTMVVDYSPHIGWTDPQIDHYYVGNELVRDRLIGYGVPPERIQVTGAPSQPGFEEVMRVPVTEYRRRLGLEPTTPTFLLMAGYLGTMVDYPGIIRQLTGMNRAIQILVVTGRNRSLYETITKRSDRRVRAFYDVPSIHTVMWAADAVISKPGGMVINDCLVLGKPMILINPRAGSLQEVIFADLIEKQGAGIHLRDASDITRAVGAFLDDPLRSRAQAQAAYELGTRSRTAAQTIAAHITNRLFPAASGGADQRFS